MFGLAICLCMSSNSSDADWSFTGVATHETIWSRDWKTCCSFTSSFVVTQRNDSQNPEQYVGIAARRCRIECRCFQIQSKPRSPNRFVDQCGSTSVDTIDNYDWSYSIDRLSSRWQRIRANYLKSLSFLVLRVTGAIWFFWQWKHNFKHSSIRAET